MFCHGRGRHTIRSCNDTQEHAQNQALFKEQVVGTICVVLSNLEGAGMIDAVGELSIWSFYLLI